MLADHATPFLLRGSLERLKHRFTALSSNTLKILETLGKRWPVLTAMMVRSQADHTHSVLGVTKVTLFC